jgi:hypothetical protein
MSTSINKACVTNPSTTGRFLVHRLSAHFSTSYGCSSKLAWKKCVTCVAVWVQVGLRCAAARHGNYKSYVISDARTPSAFLNGHRLLAAPTIYAAAQSPHGTTLDRPIPQSSSAKKVVRHCEFSEKFGILKKHYVSNDATENA